MWYQVSQPTQTKGRRIPKWALRCYEQDGRVFVPAALGASEMEVLLCASFDGVSVCRDAGHVYVDAEWLAREYPKTAETIARCVQQINSMASSPLQG